MVQTSVWSCGFASKTFTGPHHMNSQVTYERKFFYFICHRNGDLMQAFISCFGIWLQYVGELLSTLSISKLFILMSCKALFKYSIDPLLKILYSPQTTKTYYCSILTSGVFVLHRSFYMYMLHLIKS